LRASGVAKADARDAGISRAPTGLVGSASAAVSPQELPKVFEQASGYAPEFVLAGRLCACRHDSDLLQAACVNSQI
jgi:hypothetical protein